MTSYNGIFKNSDRNYLTDYTQMGKEILNISAINEDYWMPSRYCGENEELAAFGMYWIGITGVLQDDDYGDLIRIFRNENIGEEKNYTKTHGLRPVFTLKSDIRIIGGNGIENPYELEI